jgi:hypothetical protein
MWVGLGALGNACHQPGITVVCWAFAGTVWIERTIIGRKEELQVQESIDQVLHGRAMGEEIQERINRRFR